jgi:hypothetical protein
MQVSIIGQNTETLEARIDMMVRKYSSGIRLDLNCDKPSVISLLMSEDEALLLINRLSSALLT